MQDLKVRYKKFAIDVAIAKELIRSSSAALRGKSTADLINKLKIVEEELDESTYCLELILDFNQVNAVEIETLIKEGNELLAIAVKSIQTTRSKLRTS